MKTELSKSRATSVVLGLILGCAVVAFVLLMPICPICKLTKFGPMGATVNTHTDQPWLQVAVSSEGICGIYLTLVGVELWGIWMIVKWFIREPEPVKVNLVDRRTGSRKRRINSGDL